MLKYLLPLVIFVVMAYFLAVGLKLKPSEIPSPLIGKPAPVFAAPRLDNPAQQLATADLQGQVWLFNVWASWCVSCRQEHEVLNQFAQQKAVTLIGLNYKDDPTAAKNWLQQLGNPYDISIMDQDGRIGIDWGVYGVPETFVVDKKGVIRYKFTGPVGIDDIEGKILPLVAQLQAES